MNRSLFLMLLGGMLAYSYTASVSGRIQDLPPGCTAEGLSSIDNVSVLYESLADTDDDQINDPSGVYDPSMLPGLIQKGLQAQQNNSHEEAINHIEHALQVLKSDKGLYHPAQIPLLHILIKSRIKLLAWDKVTDHVDHQYWLIGRIYEKDDPATLPLLKQVRSWHMEAYSVETGRSLKEHFEISEKVYDQALATIQNCGGTERQAYCFWHRACCSNAIPEYGICPLDRNKEDN